MSSGIRDIPSLYFSPLRFYQPFDLATSYGGPLALLVVLLAAAGYTVVFSGLIGRSVDISTEKGLALIERTSVGEVKRDELDDRLRTAREAAVFWKVLASGASVLQGPVETLGRIFLGATVAFVAVALSGRKPAYHGLVSILTFASYVEVLRQAVVVPLMISLHSVEVETSLAVLLRGRPEASAWLYAGLQAVDPFSLWFYALAAIGISRSGQLSTRGAVFLSILLWAGAAGLRTGTVWLMDSLGGEVTI
ncbi:MAG: hypothetical protein KA354_08785 [Phycisphaerae bacterium]|nr:hypothetical protein [Phycisphaerae bacterium]